MKKCFWLFAAIIMICLISCSNPQSSVLTSQEDTLRNALEDKANKTVWTNEIEPERLTSKLNQNISVSTRDYVTPQMLNTIKELQNPVYPEIKGFASLDCSAMSESVLSLMNDFCTKLCKSTDELKDYFSKEYFFNYVFFKADIEPVIKDFKTEELIFDRYVICKAFENENLTQIPVRFYNNKDYVDLSIYLNYHNGYKITQIEVIRWGKTYGESEKEKSNQ